MSYFYTLDELIKLSNGTSDQDKKKTINELIEVKRMKLNALKCWKEIRADFRKRFLNNK